MDKLKTACFLFIVVSTFVLGACSELTVTAPYRAAPADTHQVQLAKLIVHNEKDGVPPYMPYGWLSADYVVISSFDGKDLGHRGALLGAPVTGDFEFPNEVDFTAGRHTFTVGIMTGCGFMELDEELVAEPGATYEAFGIIKNAYAVSYGASGGGCQASAPLYHRNSDGELVK